MPEIAEVEIVRRELHSLRGKELQSFQASKRLSAHGKEGLIVDRTLDRVDRRGKLLGFRFGGLILTAHLRMTGRFVFREEPGARAVMDFGGQELSFIDRRGFATMEVREAAGWPYGLGPDLWQVIGDPAWLPLERYQSSRRAIKASILDQHVVAGIGNYLADESLWKAGVLPTRKTVDTSPGEWRKILESAGLLSLAVLKAGGVTIRDYRNSHEEAGQGQAQLVVYGRAGQECLRCGQDLVKTRVAGRGTTFCANCQS